MKKMFKKSQVHQVIIGGLLMLGFLFGQQLTAQTVKAEIVQFIDSESFVFPEILLSQDVSFSEIAESSQDFLTDSLINRSLKAYALLYAKAQKSGRLEDRQAFVHLALDALANKSADALAEQLIAYLPAFQRGDFNAADQEKIRSLLAIGTPHFANFIKVAGFVLEELTAFRQLLPAYTNEPISRTVKEALTLAMARNGDPAKLALVSRNIKTLALGDNFIYYVAPVIIYVRQKGPTDYLLDLLLEDDLACTPADAESSGNIPCAYRLLEMLAPVIVDFPLQVDEAGDLMVEDYPKALAEARAWIRENREGYRLRREVY